MQTNSLTKEVRFILISPLGTLIQSGVKIGFDGSLINQNGFGFNICQQYGCITTLKMTENILNNFKKAKNLNLEYLDAQGRKINIDFGLKGFTEQYKKIAVN
jgi:invasion protein IalB